MFDKKECYTKYNNSSKGRLCRTKYNISPKGKARLKRAQRKYDNTPKGKEVKRLKG